MFEKALRLTARKAVEAPSASWIRSLIMRRDAGKEQSFAKVQAQNASLMLLGPARSPLASLLSDRGDVFFVLGSGASIEELSKENFAEIARHTSVGINNWGLHPFVPDLYSFESVPSVGDGSDFQRAMTLLDREDVRTRQPEILILRPKTLAEIEEIGALPISLRKSVSLYGRVTPATRCKRNLSGDVEAFFTKIAPRYPSVVLDSGASVIRMVTLAMASGFRKIVLAGVDVNGSPYFWERNPEHLARLTSPHPVNNQVTRIHETASGLNRPFDVITMLRAIDTFLIKRLGGQLLVASPHSALAEFFPLVKWE